MAGQRNFSMLEYSSYERRRVQVPSQSVNRITEGVIWKQLLTFFFPILL